MDHEALRLKKLCSARALEVVKSLLEVNNDQREFLAKLSHINQSHYDDVIEERHILKLCGYPLCPNYLDEIPTQKYIISATSNKVYDISTRKKFCCNYCYKASLYIRTQLFTSPLWMRIHEPAPEFKILEQNSKEIIK